MEAKKEINKEVIQETSTQIQTTPYAGFWIRTGANILDSLILLVPLWILNFIISLPFSFFAMAKPIETPESSLSFLFANFLVNLIIYLVDFIIWIFYFSLMESSSTQGSLGKMICGIKVIDEKGNKLNFGKAIGRSIIKQLSWLLLGLPFLMVAFTQKKQGLHDSIAKTYVVKKN